MARASHRGTWRHNGSRSFAGASAEIPPGARVEGRRRPAPESRDSVAANGHPRCRNARCRHTSWDGSPATWAPGALGLDTARQITRESPRGSSFNSSCFQEHVSTGDDSQTHKQPHKVRKTMPARPTRPVNASMQTEKRGYKNLLSRDGRWFGVNWHPLCHQAAGG